MKILQIYDPAMCCSTGICGPEVDTKLAQFAGEVEWLKAQGVIVQRHNLSQSPGAFVENEAVQAALREKGAAALPLLFANGELALSGRYPGRQELAALFKLAGAAVVSPAQSGGECGGGC